MRTPATYSDFDALIATLEEQLAQPLPGAKAQLEMAPARADAFERTDIVNRDCREAGVLALFHPLHGQPHIVLTLRRAHLADHAGQVSFPGGRRESDRL